MIPKYFDTDQHITQPPDFWTGRFAKKFADKEPRFINHEKFGPGWTWDGGKTVRPMGVESVGSEDPRKIGNFKQFEEIDPGCYDPKKRIEVMDIDGAQACLLFGNGATAGDEEWQIAGCQAYNDAVYDWSAAGDIKRIVPRALIPYVTLPAATAELQRVAKKGFKHFQIGWPSLDPMPTKADDPFFAAVVDSGMTMTAHGMSVQRMRPPAAGRTDAPTRPGAPAPASAATMEGGMGKMPDLKQKGMGQIGSGTSATQELVAALRGNGLGSTPALAAWIFSGMMDRYPKLRLSLIETSLGWLPYLGEQMDAVYLNQRWSGGVQLNRLPSEYLNETYCSFDREWMGVKYRKEIGVDRITFGSDYPHIGSFYPHTRFYIELVMQGCTEQEMEKILWSNAARAYNM